ncbi:hypothetical protein [Myxosarcina sp. GI1]|uniref:hypothetical protein n=1 Tax=Myxosarcina sp. GI1 TaxID=1541065 RepID=UPI000560FC46|nr:hypothetical protein [Myxosarcina sp. GI1]
MNKKFDDIADNFQISGEIKEQILKGMGVENFNKNPSKDKIEAFSSICESIKNGSSHEEAIANCLRERELAETTRENILSSGNIAEVSQDIGRETGRQMARIIPPLQQQGCSDVVEGFNRGLAEGFREALGEIDFNEILDDFSNLDIEDIRQGKLKNGSSNAALPQSNLEL